MIVSSFSLLFIDQNNSELAPELQPTVNNIDLKSSNLTLLFLQEAALWGTLGRVC